MKIISTIPTHERASVLLVTLVASAIIGISLASYLIMTQAQNRSVARSQNWNCAIALTEAGIEDAMAHLNSDNGMNGVFAANGWEQQADGSYAVTRSVGDGYYVSAISFPAGSFPVIMSQGFAPFLIGASGSPTPMFAAVGVDPSVGKVLSRTVRANTRLDGLLVVAMAAKENIDMKGNNVSSDSFDSADPLYSNNGLYSASKAKDHGDVVTNSTLTNSLNVGNANLKGMIRTGPNGSPAIGSNGSVGDAAWVSGGNLGIQSGHFVDDMNVVFPSARLPAVSFTPATASMVTIDGVKYKYVLGDGNWQVNDATTGIYVTGNAVVYVPPSGRVNFTGQDQIYIAQGASSNSTSLKFYVGCSTATLGGNGVINSTGNALNFAYFGLSSNTALNLSANAAFVGMIYCPDATFTLGGGGTDNYDFVGASVSNIVKMNGNFFFHYDENLRRVGPGRGYVITTWREM